MNIRLEKTSMKNKGITLIALVITIIVLLVLAGVTVALIKNDDNMISKAQWSKFVDSFSKEEEAVNVYVLNKGLDKYGDNAKLASTDTMKISALIEKDKDVYPIKGEKIEKSEIDKIKSLVESIKYIENFSEITEENVELYVIDKELIPSQDEYVVNIVSGKIYLLKAFVFEGQKYHRPEYGCIIDNDDLENQGDDNEPQGNDNVLEENEDPNSNNDEDDKIDEDYEKNDDTVYVEGLVINPYKIVIQEGETKQLSSLISIKFGEENISIDKVEWYREGEEIDDADGYERDLEEDEEGLLAYEDDIIKIQNGNVVGEVVGETKIKAVYRVNGTKYKANLIVKVQGEDYEPEQGITLLPTTSLEVNKGKRKTIVVKNNAGRRISNRKFTWVTENEQIAKVDKYGRVTGVSGVTNSGVVKLIGTYIKDTSIRVECNVTVLQLTQFTPTLQISSSNLIIINSIDKKYGMRYYTYRLNGVNKRKTTSAKCTLKNCIQTNITYQVEVIVSNGSYSVSSGVKTVIKEGLYYGHIVSNYTPSAGGTWRLFYEDSSYAYLLRDYSSSLKYAIPTTDTTDVDYYGKTLNSMYNAQGYFSSQSSNASIRMVRYLTKTSNWTSYADMKDNNNYQIADWAMGAPTLELFAKSFNQTHSKTLTLTVSSTGYTCNYRTIPHTDLIDKQIYASGGTQYWRIASPQSAKNIYDCGGNNQARGGLSYTGASTSYGLRPIVRIPISKLIIENGSLYVKK